MSNDPARRQSPKTIENTKSGRQDSNLRPPAPKAGSNVFEGKAPPFFPGKNTRFRLYQKRKCFLIFVFNCAKNVQMAKIKTVLYYLKDIKGNEWMEVSDSSDDVFVCNLVDNDGNSLHFEAEAHHLPKFAMDNGLDFASIKIEVRFDPETGRATLVNL